VRPKANSWYLFRIAAETFIDHTRVIAKVWREGESEPQNWQAQITDTTKLRFTKGTIGLWSWGAGVKSFEDLRVFQKKTNRILLSENFDSWPLGSDPDFWLDYGVNDEGLKIAVKNTKQDVLNILLSHSPDLIHEAANQNVDLMLSGHTHGGQICLPGFGALYSPAQLGREYNAGKFDFEDTILYISRGLGHVFLPLRFFCPPEITVINLIGVGYE
jgi:predicted MPP superfamily phosphohydrolase